MKLEDLEEKLRNDLETAYDVLRDEGNSEDDIKKGLNQAIETALPDSEFIDRQMLIDEIMQSTSDDSGEEEEEESDDKPEYPQEFLDEFYDFDSNPTADTQDEDTLAIAYQSWLVSQEESDDEEEVPPTPAPVISSDDHLLMRILGGDNVKVLEDAGYRIDVDRIPGKGAALFYDRDRSTRIIRMIEDIVIDPISGLAKPVLGEELTSTANILTGSIDSGIDLSKIRNQILADAMPDIEDSKIRRRIGTHLSNLTRIQDAQNNLSDVFGFDDPRELEAFFAAWLMKNSTCRLSGIPGTGKTTVINSAAIVMANSYGFSSDFRFYPRTKNVEETDLRTGVETIRRVPDNTRPRFAFPRGMSYDVSFSARGFSDSLEAWDAWRFTGWQNDGYSGAYTYDFRFLRSANKLAPLSANDFGRILYMHYRPKVDPVVAGNLAAAQLADLVNAVSKPITFTVKDTGIEFDEPKGGEYQGVPYTYDTSMPGGKDLILRILDQPKIRQHIISFLMNADGYDLDVVKLSTDTGFSEGYWLREALMDAFYDSRAQKNGGDYSGDNLESLRSEMLQEIGIAKIDNDKRADEILYGMEIQQVRENREGREVQTFVFDPIPRPIVTQPIKFFNEANRSQAGVEDAVLGLIAEREVEYRGKTFNSPAFVAWMDTNPHQKANDLAFTDRIDTELFFGTIGLGSRNAQLQSRYAGAKNAKPDIQLITRIIESRIDQPLRISELGLGRNSIWRFVDSIPFRPPEVTSGYDGLRDIATLSVLFTQRPQLRSPSTGQGYAVNYEVEGANFVDYESTNPHANPLEDISRSSVGDIISGIDRERQIHSEADSFQPQSKITRVLGFRFTDSIVKMSRALAFLRGKTYVGRSEIVDALPYCLGHRLGRARAEGDQEPSGIEQNAVISEQEYVRQILVHGYLMRDAFSVEDIGAGANAGSGNDTRPPGAFEMWDAFYAYCDQRLASAITYADFELTILRPLQVAYQTDSDNLTTVHWHLANSVVENERNGISNMHPSHYSLVCTNGETTEVECDYPDVLAHYRKMISRPEKPNDSDTPLAMQFNFAAADYFRVRGRISSDRYLFSDDKAHLLDLVDSRISSLCGRDTGAGEISNPDAIASAEPGMPEPYLAGTATRGFPGYGPNPTMFPWRSYGDTGGAWGQVLNISNVLPINGTEPTEGLNLSSPPDTRAILHSLADQNHRIVFQCFENSGFDNADARMNASDQERRFRKVQSEEISKLFGQQTGPGVIFTKPGDGPQIPRTTDPGVTPSVTPNIVNALPDNSGLRAGSAVNIIDFMTIVTGIVESRMSGTGTPKSASQELLSNGGLMACFDLKHAPGVIDRAKTTGAVPIAFDFFEQMDVAERLGQLRLWVRIQEIESGSTEYTNMVFTMGITSNLATRTTTDEATEEVLDDGTIITKTVTTLEYLGISDALSYTTSAIIDPDSGIIDSGNLTGDDVVYYDRMFSRALNARSATENAP